MDEPFEIVIPTAPEDVPLPAPPPPPAPPTQGHEPKGSFVHEALAEEEGFCVCSKCNVKFPESDTRLFDWHKGICEEVSAEGLPPHSFSRNYSCAPCQFNTTSSKIYLFHFIDLHRKNWKIFACNLCEYASRWKCKVIRHRRMIHSLDEPKFEPTQCNRAANSEYQSSPTTTVNHHFATMSSRGLNYNEEFDTDRTAGPSGLQMDFNSPNFTHSLLDSPSGSSAVLNNESPSTAAQRPSDDPGSRSRRKPQVVRKIAKSHDIVFPGGQPAGASDSDEFYSDTELEQHHLRQQDHFQEAIHSQDQNPGEETHAGNDFGNYAAMGMGPGSLNSNDSQPPLVIDEPNQAERMLSFQLPAPPPAYRQSNPSAKSGPPSGYTESEFDQVDEITLKGETLYRCKLCPFTNKNRWKTLKHAKSIHTTKRVYDCDKCDYVTYNRVDFFTHKAYHSSKGTVHCSECNYTTSSRTNMERHRENHRKNLPVKCLYCTFSSTGEAAIQRHMAECHHLGSEEVRGDGDAPGGIPGVIHGAVPGTHPEDVAFNPGELGLEDSSLDARFHDDEEMGREEDAQARPTSSCGSVNSSQRPTSALSDYEPETGAAAGAGSSISKRLAVQAVDPGPNWDGMMCRVCHYIAKCHSDRLRHNKVHSTEKSFDCKLCFKKYKYRGDLNVHIRKAHNSAPYKASIRGTDDDVPFYPYQNKGADGNGMEPLSYSGVSDSLKGTGLPTMVPLKSTSRLISPLNTLGGEQTTPKVTLSSTGAGWKTNSQTPKSSGSSPVTNHASLYKQKGKHANSSPLRCPACVFKSTSQPSLDNHMRTHHPYYEPFRCSFCTYSSIWKGLTRDHMVRRHQERLERTGADVYDAADKCLLDMDTRSRNKHRKEPEATSSGKTNQVKKTATTPSSHNKEGQKVLRCNQCSFQTVTVKLFSDHLATHEGLKLFTCSVCGKRANWKWDIAKHIRKEHPKKHADVITLTYDEAKATIGEYERKRKAGITVKPQQPKPKPVIYGNRPFKCSACPKRSNWKCDVRKHIKKVHAGDSTVHLVELTGSQRSSETGAAYKRPSPNDEYWSLRPYKCSLCSRRSNWAWDIKKHIRTMHKGKEGGRVIKELKSSQQAKKALHASRAAAASAKAAAAASDTEPKTSTSADGKKPSTVDPILEAIEAVLQGMTLRKAAQRYQIASTTLYRRVQANKSRQWSRLIAMSQEKEEELIGHLSTVLAQGQGLESHELQTLALTYTEEKETKIVSTKRARSCSFDKYVRRANRQWVVDFLRRNPEILPVYVDDDEPPITAPDSPRICSRDTAGASVQGATSSQAGRSFQCSACEQMSEFQWVIRRHIRSVHGESNAVALDRTMMRTNGDARPYICSICGKRSNWKWDVKKHILTVHKGTAGSIYDVSTYKETKILTNSTTIEIDACAKDKIVKALEVLRATNANGGEDEIIDMDVDEADDELVQDSDKQGETSYKCSYCHYVTDQRKGMAEHVRQAHPHSYLKYTAIDRPVTQAIWKCSRCSFSDTNREEVLVHIQEHEVYNAYNCSLCDFSGDLENVMMRHLRNKHSTADPSVLQHNILYEDQSATKNRNGSAAVRTSCRYVCKLCSMSSSWKNAMLRHIKDKHRHTNPETGFVEEQINVGYTSPNHSGAPSSASKAGSRRSCNSRRLRRRYHCRVCPYTTDKKNSFKEHKSRHIETEGSAKCPYCPYWVCATRLLKQHIRVHSFDIGPRCERPERIPSPGVPSDQAVRAHPTAKTPAQVDALRDHAETLARTAVVTSKGIAIDPVTKKPYTSEGRPFRPRRFQCKDCPYMSKTKPDLLYHKQFHRHKQAAPFKCPKCKYWVSRQGVLSQHLKVHDPNYIITLERECEILVRQRKRQQELVSGRSSTGPLAAGPPTAGPTVPRSYLQTSREDKEKGVAELTEAAQAKQEAANAKSEISLLRETADPGRPGAMLKKIHRCTRCPYANTRYSRVVFHEKYHDSNSRNQLKCTMCSFACSSRTSLGHHHKVHSTQYEASIEELEQEEAGSDDDGLDSESAVSEPPKASSTNGSVVSSEAGFTLKQQPSGNLTLEKEQDRKKFPCDRCPFVSTRKDQLQRHSNLHGAKHQYVCGFCDYSVSVSNLLDRHRLLHAAPNPNLQTACQTQGNLETMAVVPAEVDMSVIVIETDEGGVTDNHDHLDLYEGRDVHQATLVDANRGMIYRCDRCPFMTMDKEGLLCHLKFHVTKSYYHCPMCDYSVPTVDLVSEHMKDHFVGSEPPPFVPNNTEADPEPEYIDINDLDYDAFEKKVDKENKRLPLDGPFPCKFCIRGLNSKQEKDKHERLHLAPASKSSHSWNPLERSSR